MFRYSPGFSVDFLFRAFFVCQSKTQLCCKYNQIIFRIYGFDLPLYVFAVPFSVLKEEEHLCRNLYTYLIIETRPVLAMLCKKICLQYLLNYPCTLQYNLFHYATPRYTKLLTSRPEPVAHFTFFFLLSYRLDLHIHS